MDIDSPELDHLVGGCFCGAVRYRIDGRLEPARACHCSRCRKAFSGASSAYAPLGATASFSWTQGEALLTRYVGAAGWGMAFCARCGTTLCGVFADAVHGVTLGSIDGDPRVGIAMHLFVGSKAPWDHIGGSAPQFDEFPPSAAP